MIAILGGGIAGLSTAYHLSNLNAECKVFEKRSSWGGLCDNFSIGNGYRFDYFVHLSFTQSEYVQKLFEDSSQYIIHKPYSSNYYKGHWMKHPAQNNIASLPAAEKVLIIKDFVHRIKRDKHNNYKDWLRSQFGNYFSKTFSEPYTLKYWTLEAEKLSTNWLEGRFSLPPLENILKGAFEEQTENFYYAKDMRYPQAGGYKSFLRKIAGGSDINLNKELIELDIDNKKLTFSDGTNENYEKVVSTLPLPVLIKCIPNAPTIVKEAASNLLCTSGQLVSLGFNRPDIPKYLWFYIYDADIVPSRAYSASLKSADNVPEGCSSLQFESYFSKARPKLYSEGDLISHVVRKGETMGLWNINDIDVDNYREVEYANVIYDHDREKNLTIVHRFLNDNNIVTAGRFGEWAYLWSDQSLLSGQKAAKRIVSEKYR
ncbi:MAG: FAD-dependent oxidoreductase [Carboxylicivirga sp.]|jgi:protoporphyrinogen oxidase|nr:FAD-dependent oxidoreductase [Carboxylicivirga sp.]